MATRKKHSPVEIVRKLQEADKLLAEGNTVLVTSCRKARATTLTGTGAWLKALREENAKLKRLVAEAELEKLALKEIANRKF